MFRRKEAVDRDADLRAEALEDFVCAVVKALVETDKISKRRIQDIHAAGEVMAVRFATERRGQRGKRVAMLADMVLLQLSDHPAPPPAEGPEPK